jgi:hypothetical protein
MGIFRNITQNLKKAAPLIGSAIGMYIGGPAGYAALGGALGGGIGSLVGGGDTEDALIAAGLGGLGGYMAQGSFNTANAIPPGRTAVGSTVSQNTGEADFAVNKSIPKFVPSEDPGIFSKIGTFAKENPFTTAGIAGLGLTALGGGFDDDEEKKTETAMRPYPTGKARLGTGIVDGMEFNLNNEEERKEYFRRVREKQGIGRVMAANGGEVNGPGTGTSDSVPARLSDGEFVLTAKAVRGAGGGDRDLGAARMYDMMSELERVA